MEFPMIMRDDETTGDPAPATPAPDPQPVAKKRKSKMSVSTKKAKTAPKARKAVKAKSSARKTVKTAKAKTTKGEGRYSRVQVTLEQLKKGWTTVESLAKAFKAEFGDGKESTARLAISKVPPAHGVKIEREKGPEGVMRYRQAR
jgi:hypothetical protein